MMFKRHGKKKQYIVEGQALPCGHAIPEERPEALTALLLDFFQMIAKSQVP